MTVYYKMRQLFCYKMQLRLMILLQKYESYYKMRPLLQIATVRLVKFWNTYSLQFYIVKFKIIWDMKNF